MVLGAELRRLQASVKTAAGSSGAPRKHQGGQWLAFLSHIQAGKPWPAVDLPSLMYAGRVVDCESAGVYKLLGGGGGDTVIGLKVASEYETAGR